MSNRVQKMPRPSKIMSKMKGMSVIAAARRPSVLYDHCLRFMNGYRLGLTGAVPEYAVKKYKSRRRLSPSINLTTIEEEY